jgi:hypothetical protein
MRIHARSAGTDGHTEACLCVLMHAGSAGTDGRSEAFLCEAKQQFFVPCI